MRVVFVTPTFEFNIADTPIKSRLTQHLEAGEDVKVGCFLFLPRPSCFPRQHVISNYGRELSHSSQSRFTRRSGKSDKWQNKLTFLSLNCRQTSQSSLMAGTWVTQGSQCVWRAAMLSMLSSPQMPQILPLSPFQGFGAMSESESSHRHSLDANTSNTTLHAPRQVTPRSVTPCHSFMKSQKRLWCSHIS